MTPLKTAIIVTLATATLTAGALFQWNRLRWREAGNLRYQNSKLRMEIMQRRAEIQKSQSAPTALGDLAGQSPSSELAASTTPPTVPKPAVAYRNEGQATPQATLQTFAWACDRGDVEKVGTLFTFDPTARIKIEAYFASLPGSARQQWKTVDEMAATLLTHQGMARPFPDGDILATATVEEMGVDRVALLLPGTYRSRTEYVKTPAGWKYVITEKMVDDYINQASQRQ